MSRPGLAAAPPLARRPSLLSGESRNRLMPAQSQTVPKRWRAAAEGLATTTSIAALGSLAVPTLCTWFGPLMQPARYHAVLGAASFLGGLSTAVMVAAVLGVALTPHEGRKSEHHRLRALGAAAAQGFALAPLVAQGFGVLWGPAGAVALALTVGLNALLARHAHTPTSMPVAHMCTALMAAVVLGPLGWDVALGTAPAIAACRAVYVGCALASGRAIVAALWQLQLHYAPTPYVQRFLCDDAQIRLQRLDLRPSPMSAPPTIFGVGEDLRQWVLELKAARGPLQVPFTGWRGVPVACLCGPAGTGKTLSAQGIAHALGAELAAVSSAELAVEAIHVMPVAGLNLLTLIAEAELYGQRVHKPVVVFIDEVDNFLPTQSHPARTHEDINRAINVALLHMTLGYLDDDKNHVMVIFATNHVARIAPALGLLTLRTPILLDIPMPKDLVQVLQNKCVLTQSHFQTLGIDCPRLDSHANIARMGEEMAEAGLSGRDAEALISSGSDAVLAYVSNRRAQPSEAWPKSLDEVFFTRLQNRLDTARAQARSRGPKAAQPEPIAARSLREFMRDSGVHAADAEQLIRYAVTAVAQGSTDPGQQLRMTQVGGRALRSAWQLVARATARAAPSTSGGAQRHFNDVPRR